MRRMWGILALATVSAVLSAHLVTRAHRETEAIGSLRGAAALTLPPPPPTAQTDAAVRKAADGHFWAEAQVDGRHVRFLVDTGASTVALTLADAQRLGYAPRDLAFDKPVSTASGQTMGAAITLDYVSVSGARVDDVDALVLQEGLETYLGRLSRFEASRDALILRR
jgi:aspartyl protease family protein